MTDQAPPAAALPPIPEGAVLALARELIQRESVTPADAGCQALIAERLRAAGFRTESLPFGEVSNLWARAEGTGGDDAAEGAAAPGSPVPPAGPAPGRECPVLCFAGHTDVVPTGPVERWRSPPFTPTVRDGRLYGRGAADMKGGLAAMVVACETWRAAHPDHGGALALLLTSDEEGPARDGTRRVMETLHARGEHITWCVVGEPSSQQRLGDVVRIGRRGSLTGRLRVRGIQGHVAYPDKARNPIHQAAPALAELAARRWDGGNDHFPPTSFQIAGVQAGTGATNVIPATLDVLFNFRHSTEWSVQALQTQVEATLARHGIRDYALTWDDPPSAPFLSERGALCDAVAAAVTARTGSAPVMDTGGGTSDGRFIAPYGAEVVELGLVNASIHQIDEHASLQDLDELARLYLGVIARLLGPGGRRAAASAADGEA